MQPSYTGFVFPVDKYFPAWALEEDHPLVQAGQQTRKEIGLPDPQAASGTSPPTASTGRARLGFPPIGFGPGDEETAHTVNDSVSLDDMVKATEFYALLPSLIK